jgi:hypothetical protein
MLHKARAEATKRRARGRPGLASHLGQILFRLGEVGAVGLFVLAGIKATRVPLKAGLPLDVYFFAILGLTCFLAGWLIRRALTGNSGPG